MPYESYSRQHVHHFEPGDTVAVRFGGILWHYGIVTHNGTVISNSRRNGGVVEQSLSGFANGKPIRLCEERSGLDAIAMETRARRAKGASYDLAQSNCIDFTRYAHRRSASPWQIASATLAAFKDYRTNKRERW